MSSYFVKSKNATLAELAAAREIRFLEWIAANHSNPAARAEAADLLAHRPDVSADERAAILARIEGLDREIAALEAQARCSPSIANSSRRHAAALRMTRRELAAAL